MKRKSIFAVTENGKTRYCESKSFSGLSGIALKLCLHTQDENGSARPLFDRLDSKIDISREYWQKISDAPDEADKYSSFIQIDADKNIVCADEDWPQERCYVEVPLDKLLETAKPLIEKSRHSGYPILDRIRLYSLLQPHFDPRHGFRFAEVKEKSSVLEQIRAGMPPREGSKPHIKKMKER